MLRFKKSHVVLFSVWILAFMGVCFAQSGGSSILGTLTDQGDAVVPQGKITVTELSTGATQTVVSNETGLFRVLNLLPGKYSLRVVVGGFKTIEIAEIVLASSEARDLGRLRLQIGTLTEEVSVTAAATPVQTASSERSALIDSNQLQDVALKGRDAFGYLKLLPGVVDTASDRSLAGPGSSANININGMASNTKNVSFDGVTQLDQGGANSVYVSPSMDAVGEIRVMTNAFQAEYGRTVGGQINMITKAGTQEFHGSAFWNRRHESLNANNFFNNRSKIQRPIYRYFVGGGTVGGPIYIPGKFNTEKRKLFFFWSEEITRVALPTSNSLAKLPTAAERAGDFSGSVTAAGSQIKITDPFNNNTPFANNVIPASRIDPTGLAFLNLFQKPTGYVDPTQPYAYNFLASSTPFQHRRDDIIRVDANFIKNTMIYVRYGNDTSDTRQEFRVAPGVGPLVNFSPGYNWSGHVINAISPTLVNEVTVGVGHNNWGFTRAGGDKDENYYRTSSFNPPTMRTLPTGDLYPPYLPSASFAGGSLPNPGSFTPSTTIANIFPVPFRNANDTYSIQEDIGKVLGNHSLKAGFYWERNVKSEPLVGATYAGLFNFGSSTNNPLDTGNGYSNALLGVFQTYQEASIRVSPNSVFNQLEGYFQDNWRVNRRLTVDAGIRWYHIGLSQDSAQPYSNFYPQYYVASKAARIYRPATVNGKTVAIDPLTGNTTFAALQNTYVPGSGDTVNGMRVNGATGSGDFASFPSLLFTPRLGFAWDISGNGKTAIRASFGTFYQRPNYNWVPGRGTPPVLYTPTIYYSQISNIPQAAAAAAISPYTATAIFGDQKIERNHQFNFTIQRDIGFQTVVDVAYVGNFNRHAQNTRELNPIPLGAYANPANLFNGTKLDPNHLRTAYPGMGSIIYYSNSLSSLNYHGLQFAAQHRMSHGLQFGVSYVFSKALGTCGTPVTTGSGCTISDPFHGDREWWYGPLPWDRTHVMNVNYVYQIPGVEQRVLKHVTKNWTLSGISTFTTGAPLTPTCTAVTGAVSVTDPTLSGGTARCQIVSDPKAFTQSFFTNFNTSAFAVAPAGTFGNSGLGILRQPSRFNMDLTLDKRIPLGKDTKRAIRARIEAYNALNHTQFSTINAAMQMSGTTNISNTYGQFTAAENARVISTTLRFEF